MTTSTTEMPKLRLGDWVSCSAYIRPSGNHFEIDNEDTGTALLWRKDATEGEEIEDYESCEKFVTKMALFTGVFVGVTWLCTELFCEWNDPPYGRSGFQCSSINPKPFAIVYYAENKKRLVPMDSIARTERVRTASGSARSASQRHAIVPALAVCSAASAKQSRNASSCRRSCAVRRAVSASAGFSAFSSGKTLCRSRLRTQSSAAFVESSTCGRRCASR